jgi:glycosyltransferase involved in cell wall biosynthesis
MVTVVMPAYNEAEIIERTIREWHSEVLSRIPGADLIVVDDCSTDQTGAILQRLATELNGIRYVRMAANSGHGRALRAGLEMAVQPLVFQTDSDRQHLAADFWRLWEKRDSNDFVFAVRYSRADGSFRKFITGSMRLLNYLLWGKWIRDANCPFKLMHTDAMKAVLEEIPRNSFIPMVMLSILVRRSGYRTTEVEVEHLARRGGNQSLKGVLKWFRIGTRCSWQLLKLRLSVSRPR